MLFDEKILRQKEWSSVLIKKQNKRKSQTKFKWNWLFMDRSTWLFMELNFFLL